MGAFAPVLMKGYGPASDKSLFKKNYFKGWNTLHDFCPPVYSLEMSKLAVKSQSQSTDLRNCDGQRIFQSDLKWFCIALQMFWSINNRNRDIWRKMRYVWTLSRTKHTWPNTHDTHPVCLFCLFSFGFLKNVYHLYCTIPDKPVHPDAGDQAYSLVKMHCWISCLISLYTATVNKVSLPTDK